MPQNIGQAYVQIVPSADGITGSIEKVLSPEAESAGAKAGSSLGKSIGGALKTAVAAIGIGKIIGDSISAGADLEQQIGGVETLFAVSDQFKEMNRQILADSGMTAEQIEAAWQEPINTVLANAQNAYKEAGMSQNEYMETINGFAAALNQSTGDVQRSAEVGQMAVTDMSDNANKMGTSIDAIKNAYAGFAKQNYTMLDNLKLGYGGTAEEMARLVNDAGLLGDTVKVTSKTIKDVPLDVIFESIHQIQDEMGITGTTAREAATTFSGSLGMLQASWQNVLAAMTLGDGLEGALSGLGESLVAFGGNAFRMISNLVMQIPSLFSGIFSQIAPQIFPAIQGMLTQLQQMVTTGLPQMLTAGQGIITNIMTGITTTLPQILTQGTEIVTSLVNGILAALPNIISTGVDIINGIINSILAAIPQLATTGGEILTTIVTGILTAIPMLISGASQIIANLVTGLQTGLPQIILTAGELITNFINAFIPMLPQIWTQGTQLIMQLISGIIQALPQIITAVARVVAQILAAFGQNLPKLLQQGIELLGEVAKGIIKAIPELVAKLPEVFDNIVNSFKEFDWASIGKNILDGIGQGITNAIDTVVNAAKGAGSKIKESLASFFSIGSPSKVMADEIGRWLPSGIAVGFLDNLNPAIESMQGGVQRMVNGLQYSALDAQQPVMDPSDRLIDAMSRQSVNVTVTLQGDAQKLFRMVNQINERRTRATNYNALAMG